MAIGPDGPEEREAYAQEESWADDERLDGFEDRADSDLMDIAQAKLESFEVTL